MRKVVGWDHSAGDRDTPLLSILDYRCMHKRAQET